MDILSDGREAAAYWQRGHEIVTACLKTAVAAKHEDAPFPFDAEQASLWHTAQMEAYRHALEMMGIPECYSSVVSLNESEGLLSLASLMLKALEAVMKSSEWSCMERDVQGAVTFAVGSVTGIPQ